MAIPLMLPLPLLYTFSTFSPHSFLLSLSRSFFHTVRLAIFPWHGLEGARERCNNRRTIPDKSILFSLSLFRGMGNSIAIDGRSFFSNSLLSLFLASSLIFSRLSLTNVLTTRPSPGGTNFPGAGFLSWFFFNLSVSVSTGCRMMVVDWVTDNSDLNSYRLFTLHHVDISLNILNFFSQDDN